MNKFAIISAVLVFSIVTVMGDFVIRDYMGRQLQTSVLTSNQANQANSANQNNAANPDSQNPVASGSQTNPSAATNPATSSTNSSNSQTNPTTAVFPTDPTNPSTASTTTPTSRITGAILTQAGFTATPSEKHFDGKVFQLLDITKNPVSAINYWEETSNNAPIASITEIILPDEIRALQMYVLLQNKTKTYIDLSLNETNAYGDRSFYINHAKKADEAFLTVKIGKTLYCFAYLKSYHPQIKQLISLLAA